MRHSSALLVVSSALVLSGCSAGPVFTSTATPSGSTPGIAISGRVHGGQNPISGAQVYLYAVNNTGYAGSGIVASSGNAAVSLLKSPGYVTTASDGTFSITSDYTCSVTTPNVYLLAVGGNSGSGMNSAITLAAGLGPCSALTSSTFVTINEVSTVAAAYAAAGFATDPTHVSSSSTSLGIRGVEDALATIVNLETISTGVALATTPGSTSGNTGAVPQNQIDTLANILAACVNSTGSSSAQCTTLFNNAENGSTPAPDTATAALNIAHNPGANIANLYGLQTASSPFQPDLSAAPNDFTIAITYTGGGLSLPYSVAIDASDDVWVDSQDGVLSKFNPLGVALSGDSGYTGTCIDSPHGIAIDSSGNVWVTNSSSTSNICEYSSAGVPNNTPFTGGGLNNPYGIAMDGSGNMWVSNYTGNSISEFNSSGTPVSSTGYTAGGIDSPYGIAVAASGDIWIANNLGTPSISELSSTGSAVGLSPFTGGGLDHPIGIAIDGTGNAWIANNFSVSISEFNSSGTAKSGSSGDTGGGLDNPYGIAVDSNGNIWAVNETNNSISEFNSSGAAISGVNGYTGTLTGLNALAEPYFLAIDGSGNIWVTNFGYETVTEFVGIAAPVVTPIAANLQSPYSANDSAVNRP
jgi:streptogramin lyase